MGQSTLPDGVTAQHEHFSVVLEDLKRAHDSGENWHTLAAMVDQLIIDVREHFEQEEELMAKGGYPDLSEHRGHHETFVRRLQVLRAELDRKETELISVITELLAKWFHEHERTADRAMMSFLNIAP
jgi:hemerythrin-like metal-binding protein